MAVGMPKVLDDIGVKLSHIRCWNGRGDISQCHHDSVS